MSRPPARSRPHTPDDRPRRPPPAGARARLAAADLLILTLEQGRTFDEALARSESFAALTGPDRGFARAMASAALRHLGRIDLVLTPFLERPIDTATAGARALLRVGAAQLFVLGTSDHAAVSETVAAAGHLPGTANASGFLNAVLRKAAEAQDAFDAMPAIATWPTWLQGVFADSLSREASEAYARAALEIPALDLTGAPEDIATIAEATGGRVLSPGAVRLEGAGSPENLPGYEEGRWWVQDRAAQVPVHLFGDIAGETVIDLCAAPGGKSLQLAARGAKVIAVDRSRARLKRLKANATRTGLGDRIEMVEADAEKWRPDEEASHILLDAPCSALGTLRRHPEGAWIKTGEDISGFPAVQARLLRAAAGMLRPGGQLVYCVCSPLRAEGSERVEAVLGEGLFERLPIEAERLGLPPQWNTPSGDLLTLPDPDAPDGLNDAFHISRLRRV